MLDHAVNGEKSYEHGNLRQVNVSVLAENCPEPKKCSHCGKKGHLAKDPGKKPMAKPKAKSQPTKPSGRGKGRGKGAGLVRDMVGQQLEIVEIVTNFPETSKKQQQQRNQQTNTHTQARHRARQTNQGNL